jgi:chromosome segregation ATPase
LVGNDAKLNEAVRDLGVKLNKGVVQEQIDDWNKQLDKAGNKAESASKASDKTQGKLNKSQSKVAKASKERSKLQGDHAVLQKGRSLNRNGRSVKTEDLNQRQARARWQERIEDGQAMRPRPMGRNVSVHRALPDAQKPGTG